MVKLIPSALFMLLPGTLFAIPNSILGPVAAANSPLNGRDLTAELIDDAVWAGRVEPPGTWQEEGRVVSTEISHLLARPKLLGQDVVLLRASMRDGRLITLDATFADAGSFFGYFDEALPQNLSRRAQREELKQRLAGRQAEFSNLYSGCLDAVRAALAGMPGMNRSRETKVGHTRTLRTVMEDFTMGDLRFRLLVADQRLVRLTIGRSGELPNSWLDLQTPFSNMYRIIFKNLHHRPEPSKICSDLCIQTRVRPPALSTAFTPEANSGCNDTDYDI